MYSTNLTDTKWQIIKNILDSTNRKRKHSLRTTWDAIMYVLKKFPTSLR
jgi:hypothetical protein